MLDHVCIFSKSGVVLWSKTMAKLKGSPVEDLIKSVLLEERGGAAAVTTDWYKMQWTLANDLDFIVVAVYQKMLQLAYIEELLDRLKREFTKRCWPPVIQTGKEDAASFDVHFARIFKEVASRSAGKKGSRDTKAMDSLMAQSASAASSSGADENQQPASSGLDQQSPEEAESTPEDEIAAARARLQARARGGGGASRDKPSNKGSTVVVDEGSGQKKTKQATVWHDGTAKALTKKQRAELNKSKEGEADGDVDDSAVIEEMKNTYLPAAGERAAWQDEEAEDRNAFADDDGDTGGGGSGWGGSLGRLFQGITGNAVLTAEDLAPALEQMKSQLITKNVATEIAENICESVKAGLVGKRLGSFTRVKTAVQAALKDAIVRVLTPKTSTDVLRRVLAARGRGRPFSIVFVGVNGVGKSTTLAKVAYYLGQHGVKTTIAACDTFRSGAVEQLRVHSRCLNVPLFERGYAKDPAAVAKAAIQEATEEKLDCVLVDTAGRMQNNEPLMRALGKLVSDNEPDLVLFVGEALVGNDGIDQLQMFNRALASHSAGSGGGMGARQVDGVVLTKFDTVDTKVGAALSMSFKTGAPIVFVGTGQKYTHLRRLNVGYVLKALFS